VDTTRVTSKFLQGTTITRRLVVDLEMVAEAEAVTTDQETTTILDGATGTEVPIAPITTEQMTMMELIVLSIKLITKLEETTTAEAKVLEAETIEATMAAETDLKQMQLNELQPILMRLIGLSMTLMRNSIR
jgi:hypothetical protein